MRNRNTHVDISITNLVRKVQVMMKKGIFGSRKVDCDRDKKKRRVLDLFSQKEVVE